MMSFIDVIPEEAAEGDTAALYAEDRAALGYVANYTKVMSHRPNVMRAWQQLNGAIKSNMDLRWYELATVAAARQLKSSYCSLAHGKVLQKFYDSRTVGSIARDYRAAGLDPRMVALMAFAEKVAADADQINQGDIDLLRDHGFNDVEIFDIASAAAARCFFAKLTDALGALPDPSYRQLDPEMREPLTVGRPIAE